MLVEINLRYVYIALESLSQATSWNCQPSEFIRIQIISHVLIFIMHEDWLVLATTGQQVVHLYDAIQLQQPLLI